VMSGDPKLEASQVLPDFDYAGYARLLGLHGVRVDRPEDVGAAWDECLNAGRPALLEAITDPEVPPLPPHIRFEQAKGMAHALAGRDPAAREMITQSLKGKLAEFTHR
jgi:pyruvate dehydrogenase (quinone)